MIIGIDIRCLMDGRYSGVGEYTYNLLDNLFKIDRENEYRLFYNSFRDVRQNLPRWDYPNVRFYGHRWPNKILNFCFQFFSWPRADQLIGGCDVFFIPNLHFIALSDSCRKVATIHDLSFALFSQFFNLKRKLWHWIIWSAPVFKKVDLFLVVSENTASDLKKFLKIQPEKIKATSLAAGINGGVVDLAAVKKKYGLPEKFVLFMGTIDPRKNVLGVIEGFEMFLDKRPASALRATAGDGPAFAPQDAGLRWAREINLVLAGATGWNRGYARRVEKAIEKSKFKNQIKIIGYVDEADKAAVYTLAECLLFPSFHEGFGIPILEAFQCGCPVITSLSAPLSDLARDAAILVEPNNVAEIAQAIEMVLTDENLRQELISKGKKRAAEFSWERAAEETLLSLRGQM